MPSRSIPLIFLAFANDRQDSKRYLRNLPEEKRRVTERLDQAQDAGLCEFVVNTNTTVEELFDIFQDPDYKGRITIFHFGGHAGSYQLLLETEEGNPMIANSGGLADFLGKQLGLQLVFLNGCSTEPQVERLLAAGVPAVIATSHAINDDAAAEFSVRFYAALAAGSSLGLAYDEAVAAVKTTYCGNVRGSVEDNMRNILLPEAAAVADRWPWAFYVRDGAHVVKEWSLPNAVGDPLIMLPQPREMDLPADPFRYLQWYRRQDARIFFGRGNEIRELYEQVTAESEPPMTLLYGQSGVGKSSLLAAGVLPRLEHEFNVIYVRRDPALGALDSLRQALGDSDLPLATSWRKIRQQSGQPLMVVLDQLEEAYTSHPDEGGREIALLMESLSELFLLRDGRPEGHLILSFRKEWFSEISLACESSHLPYSRVYLDRLSLDGILEILSKIPPLYDINIDEELPERLVYALSDDPDSPLAPTLQVFLTRMWEAAEAKSPSNPHFSMALYQELRDAGWHLDDFLGRQIEAMRMEYPTASQSGLLLDVLVQHVSATGTKNACEEASLAARYRHRAGEVKALLSAAKKQYILSEPAGESTEEKASYTQLAHDALAPLVLKRHKNSDAPGQRAQRILANRSRYWRDDKTGAPLDTNDLATVEGGMSGMRALNKSEERLVAASRLARKRRRIRQGVFGFLGLLLPVIAVFTYIELHKYDSCNGTLDGGAWCRLCIDGDGAYFAQDNVCFGGYHSPFDLEKDFVRIEAGAYIMGSETGRENEKPIHPVAITKPFYLGKTEVTQAQWFAVMGKNPSFLDGFNMPVESVSWNDVNNFLDSLNSKENCPNCYRLPTEEEWEFAARAGTKTAYSFGEDENLLNDYGWFKDNAGRPQPVGQKAPNPWGLYDVHGNVWEWVADSYYDFPPVARASITDSTRIVRGGGWSGDASRSRSADRDKAAPNLRNRSLGFRVARDIP